MMMERMARERAMADKRKSILDKEIKYAYFF